MLSSSTILLSSYTICICEPIENEPQKPSRTILSIGTNFPYFYLTLLYLFNYFYINIPEPPKLRNSDTSIDAT